MKNYTDLEQSKKLAEILPIESVDMHYVRKTHDFMGNPVDGEWSHPKYGNPNSEYANYIVQNFTSYEKIPCWSLAALLSVLPFQLIVNNQRYGFGMTKGLDKDGETYAIKYATFHSIDYFHLTAYYSSPVDACVEMVLKLKEENLL